MAYGAYFYSGSLGWVTPDMTPMHFDKKITTTVMMESGAIGAWVSTGIASSVVMIPFVQVEGANSNVTIETVVRNGVWQIEFGRGSGTTPVATFTARIYIFRTVVPQPLPDWGIAIFNSSGQCILTHETNPLRITESLILQKGALNVPAQTKTYQNKSMAVYPSSTGYTAGTINSGGSGPPLVVQAWSAYCAQKKGNDTLITPAYVKGTSGAINYYFSPSIMTYVIDTSFYD
ncbi:DUF6453 family protein [Citrobacter sp. CK206]|uniref:DUF6453 family protein n=1 Tax=Citrobacter sp. CK206 TaxID=2985115 RepID=UPI002578A0A4|nr:DUF6453 family protein [Citrobacter sp. CK206]MDM2956194.1 DUF6453 family protein [Citrobacter sp. CK206]